jgi:2-polyprenyl-3-methyl-5-hydroxy-6-metoxy-1,4-benzoquinol methylase
MDKLKLLTLEGGYDVVKCKKCNFVFVDVNFSVEELKKFYTQEYFTKGVNYFSNQERTYMAGRYIDEIKKFKKKGTLLEIGCAAGYLLKLAQEQGLDSYGVEISEDASKFAREKLGLKVKNCVLEDAKFESSFFDVVILINVLEHLPDPLGTLKEINRISKDDGIVYICVPNLNRIDRKLHYLINFFRYKNGFGKLHLSEFTLETLTKMCELSGFKVVSLKTRFFAHYLYELSKAVGLDKKMVKKIKPESLENTHIQKSPMNQIWGLINKMDKTRCGIDIQVHLRKAVQKAGGNKCQRLL